MNATKDQNSVKYGIPFVYHTDDFLDYKFIAMTKLDTDLKALRSMIGPLSKETFLILVKDSVSDKRITYT